MFRPMKWYVAARSMRGGYHLPQRASFQRGTSRPVVTDKRRDRRIAFIALAAPWSWLGSQSPGTGDARAAPNDCPGHFPNTLTMRAPFEQRSGLSEQLLQPSLLQRLVGANRDAIAPATNLLNSDPMTGGRLTHLDLEFGCRRDRVSPTIVRRLLLKALRKIPRPPLNKSSPAVTPTRAP